MELPKTPEELQTMITNAVNEATSGLVSKRDELLGKLDKFKGIDIDALQAASTELAEIKKKQDTDQGNYKKLYEEADKGKQTLQQQLEAEKKNSITTKKKSDLMISLIGAKVVPELLDVAVNSLIDVVELGDDGKAVVGGKPINDYIKEWSTSDVGKHFVKSSKKGGGSTGEGDNSNTGEEAGWFKKGTPTFNLTKQALLAKNNPTLHAQLKKQFG